MIKSIMFATNTAVRAIDRNKKRFPNSVACVNEYLLKNIIWARIIATKSIAAPFLFILPIKKMPAKAGIRIRFDNKIPNL